MTLQNDSVRAVRLLHTSDLHLHTTESCQILEAIVDRANALAVDLVLISGDLFDSNRVTEETVERALQEIGRLTMSAVILPGNHDLLDDNSVYHRVDLGHMTHLITDTDGEQVAFPDLDLVVWGKAMEEHSPQFHPLEGAPSRNGQTWHVGMAHGFHFSTGDYPDRSSPIFPEDIAATKYDYLALGHVHIFRDVSVGQVRAVYSGAPEQSLYPSQEPAQVALVHLIPSEGVLLERVPLSTNPVSEQPQ